MVSYGSKSVSLSAQKPSTDEGKGLRIAFFNLERDWCGFFPSRSLRVSSVALRDSARPEAQSGDGGADGPA